MATNQKFDDLTSMILPVADGCAVGVAVMVNDFCAVTRTPEGEGVGVDALEAVCDLIGAYDISVAGALAVGQKVYMTGTPSGGYLQAALTATATNNTHWGYACVAKGSGTAVTTVRPKQV